MTFAEAVQGYEEHEFAIRCSASIVIQSRIDLDYFILKLIFMKMSTMHRDGTFNYLLNQMDIQMLEHIHEMKSLNTLLGYMV